MDRCRCAEYEEAVKKLRFYTVGTYRPDIIDNYDRSQYVTAWVKMGISHNDLRFKKVKAWKKVPRDFGPEDPVIEHRRALELMPCPYMTQRSMEVAEPEENK